MTPRLGRAFRPSLLQLEDRVTPASFSVRMAPSEGEGSVGDTDATHAGILGIGSAQTGNGTMNVDAANPAKSVVAAVTGTVEVTLGSITTAYPFGPATAGESMSERKPFLVESEPGAIAMTIRFEDRAGEADYDYDYNDHYWSLETAALYPDDQFLIDSGSVVMANSLGKTAGVNWSVRWTDSAASKYLWRYDVTNNDLPGDGVGDGVYQFQLRSTQSPDPAYDLTASNGWLPQPGGAVWTTPDPSGIMVPGGSGRFEFKTEPRPIVLAPAGAYASLSASAEQVPQPGPLPTVHITYPDGSDVTDAKGLEVALWNGAFTSTNYVAPNTTALVP